MPPVPELAGRGGGAPRPARRFWRLHADEGEVVGTTDKLRAVSDRRMHHVRRANACRARVWLISRAVTVGTGIQGVTSAPKACLVRRPEPK